MKLIRITVIAFVLLVLIAASVFAYSNHIRSKKFASAFEGVRIGDEKETVLQLFGTAPEQISKCSDPHNEFGGKCSEVYWYFAFLERWEVYLDRNGRVLDKGHEVSF
jgi:hypothetical protein